MGTSDRGFAEFRKEEVICHVIDMDDTGMLFGRPWHESAKGIYCKDYTYLFRANKKEHQELPCQGTEGEALTKVVKQRSHFIH